MNLKGFLDGLAQQKYLVYFMLAWAGTFFFWAISGTINEINYINNGYDTNIGYMASSVVYILSKLLDLGAGIVLAIVSLKLLIPNFIAGLKRELMVVYFLLLWAGAMFFDSLSSIIWDTQAGVGIGFLGTLCELAAGGVLALFAWNLLKSKTSIEEPVTQVL
jgi:hypothetical protein